MQEGNFHKLLANSDRESKIPRTCFVRMDTYKQYFSDCILRHLEPHPSITMSSIFNIHSVKNSETCFFLSIVCNSLSSGKSSARKDKSSRSFLFSFRRKYLLDYFKTQKAYGSLLNVCVRIVFLHGMVLFRLVLFLKKILFILQQRCSEPQNRDSSAKSSQQYYFVLLTKMHPKEAVKKQKKKKVYFPKIIY